MEGRLLMTGTNAFDYINVLDKAADASWLRNDAISNNIANVDTPNYKRQDVSFESELKKALGNSRYISTDAKVAGILSSEIQPRVYTDSSSYSYRLDGNNVDIENENVMLAENQLKYEGLLNSISKEFENLQTVMK
jgi:flagellar basal-body rod protein FlgB